MGLELLPRGMRVFETSSEQRRRPAAMRAPDPTHTRAHLRACFPPCRGPREARLADVYLSTHLIESIVEPATVDIRSSHVPSTCVSVPSQSPTSSVGTSTATPVPASGAAQ